MALSIQRSDLITYLRDNHYAKVDSTATRLLERSVEHGLKLVSRERYWSFLQDDYQIISVVPYTTGTISVTIGDTAHTLVGSTLPSNIVASSYTTFLEVNGEANWREVTIRGGNTSLTCRFAYAGSASLSGVTYVIAYPAYDLPLNFRRKRSLIDMLTRQPMRYVEWDDMQWGQNEQAGTGNPVDYTIHTRRNDDSLYQLWLWPAPSTTVKVYNLIYWKDAGWFDTNVPATSTWKREATLAGDYVDWPVRFLDLLRQACLVSLYREVETAKFGTAMEAYARMLADAIEDDEVSGEIRTLSSGQPVSRPTWSLE